jgi:hypothetical protein
MPGYQVEVIDLGLHLQEALDLELPTEKFTRKNDLPWGLHLTEIEEEYFKGHPHGRKSWICQRVELNAFTAPALVHYIEAKLQAAGALGKVIPPEDDLVPQARGIFRDQVDDRVDHLISQLLPVEAMKQAARASLAPDLSMARGWVEEAFDEDPSISWEKALQRKFSELVDEHEEEITDLMREHIKRTQESGV